SSAAALSRTERVSMWATLRPAHPSVPSGPHGLRAREGLSPKRPHHPAGSRIEPPESLPWAIGTRPAATAAADPVLDPEVDRLRPQGLLVGPGRVVSPELANSDVALFPITVSPARRRRTTSSESWSEAMGGMNLEPRRWGAPV